MTSPSILNLIAASFISTGCLSSISKRRKLPLSLAIMLSRLTLRLSEQGTGLLPLRCLQRHVTRQLGNYGDHEGYISEQRGTTYLLCLSRSCSFIHTLTHTLTDDGGGIFSKSFILDTETAFRSEQRGFSSTGPSFPLINFHRVPFSAQQSYAWLKQSVTMESSAVSLLLNYLLLSCKERSFV